MTINCPKCGKVINFTISDSISDDGEVYKCPYCLWKFRFVDEL